MFTLRHLECWQRVAKVDGDQVEDAEQARLRANAQARGEVEPDLTKDLPKYFNASYPGAKGAAKLLQEFHPKEDDRREPPGAKMPPYSELAQVDGVAVPDREIFKTVFSWI